MAFVKKGLIPDAGVTFFLPRVVGLERAMEMSMLGEAVGAEEAQRVGLVNKVVSDERLEEEVSAEKYPEKTAIIYYGTEIPYERLDDVVHALARYLQQDLGVKKGDRVVLSALGRVHRRITQERVRQDPLARVPGEGARKAVVR